MTSSTRSILIPGQSHHAAVARLLEASADVLDLMLDDVQARENLAEMMRAGAVVQVRVAMPSGRVALELVRGEQRDVLGIIGETPMRAVAN